MNQDVFLAILAMDSYNRGYGQNINGLSDAGSIGNATIVRQSNILPGSAEVNAGFYAIAYNWNGETVISYRGTIFSQGDALAPPLQWRCSGVANRALRVSPDAPECARPQG